jgi:uncharacterized membrane protein YqjE
LVTWGHKEESVGTLVGRLVEDTRGLAKAEIELAKVRVGERVVTYRSAAVLFAVAGVLALAALIALLVGLIMTFATLVGPAFATAIVVIVTLMIAGVFGLMGKAKLDKPVPEASS